MRPMTRDEVLDLLSVAIAYDNRRPDEAQVVAWEEAARRGRWTFGEAREALLDHYARTTDFVMPGHITEALRVRRSAPPPARAALPAAPPASRERVAAVVAAVGKQLGWDGPEPDERRAILAHPCPHCRALPGAPCTRPSTHGSVALSGFHPSRAAATGQTAASADFPAAPSPSPPAAGDGRQTPNGSPT